MLSRVGWLSLLVLVSSTAWALDEALPHYEKVSGISGSLLSVGSDTLAGMTTLWVEEFQAYYLQSMRKCKPRFGNCAASIIRKHGAVWPDEPPNAQQ